MAGFRDARNVPSNPTEEILGAEALYNRGMACYRRRQWQQAQDCFQRLKMLDSSRRGIDILLDELEIFIRLESLATFDASPELTPEQAAAPPATPLAAANDERSSPSFRPSSWLVPAVTGAVTLMGILAFLSQGIISPHVAVRADELCNQGQAYRQDQRWLDAINVYEQSLLLEPNDLEVRDGLWTSYYEQGDQRAREAQRLEDAGRYAEATEQWEKALADFRAAEEVDPDHRSDPRGGTAVRIIATEKRKRCALLLAQGEQLKNEGRWLEASLKLQVLQAEDARYHSEQVRAYLGECYLQAGQEVLSNATTLPRMRQGVGLLEQAAEIRPSGEVQASLVQGRTYLQAIASLEGKQWDTAIANLETLLQDEPDYANGHAREMLCQSYLLRGDELFAAGNLSQALSDYQTVLAWQCGQPAGARQKVRMVSLALTPTVMPTRLSPTEVPVLLKDTTPPDPLPQVTPVQIAHYP